MKTLLVLRHGKSSWADPELRDHDRPLKKRGRRDAPRMGRLALGLGLVPDLIVSSTGRRARDTAIAFAEAAGYEGVVQLESRLYEADVEDVLEVLRPLEQRRVMVVGHNPTLEWLIQGLAGESQTMPTAALAVIDLPIKRWSDCKLNGKGALGGLWRPRELS